MPSSLNLPTSKSERSDILDVLRGIALFGICLANYPVISLFIFQPPEIVNAWPTAGIDKAIAWFHFIFIDGKFYSLFSLLFGIGFAIIIYRQANMRGIFIRRMLALAVIGLAHALLIWEGDILLLYALLGMVLLLFKNSQDRVLLISAAILILLPVLIDLIKVWTNGAFDPGAPLRAQAMQVDTGTAITMENFPTWLIHNTSYNDLLNYNQSGFFWRWEMLISSNRLPKVLGLFLLGLYIGRKRIYANLEQYRKLLSKVQLWGLVLGLPIGIAHAWFELDSYRLPAAMGMTDTLSYAFSVVPMSLFYASTICLLFLKPPAKNRLMLLAPMGRMALTNYLMQSVIGVLVFYGLGLGLGATTGLAYVYLICLAVLSFQCWFSHFWLSRFQYGPVEWLWRQASYGKRLPLTKPIERSA